jgi:phosphate transport system permease protein
MSSLEGGNPFQVSKRGKRRKRTSTFMEALGTAASLLAVAVLVLVIASVFKHGAPALNWAFLTQTPSSSIFITNSSPTGGIANSIVGTVIMVAIATVIAVPVGILTAIFTTEFARPSTAALVRLVLNMLAGIPTIVIGVFIFTLIVLAHGQSGFAAGIALSIIMLPLIARSTEEVLLLVPPTLREGGMALGATRSHTVITVILPTALGGIVTATIVAVARAAGETAPLLFTSALFANTVSVDPSQPMASIPLSIFENSEQPSQALQQQAWAAALVLITIVLLGSVLGRLLSLRTRRQIEQMR